MTPQTRKSANRQRSKASRTATAKTATATPTKLDRIIALLRQENGASLAELCTTTGWQAHSVRGAIAGALKKKGHVITSEKINGVRRYHIGETE